MSPYNPLARHILWAYLAGLTDFGHENQLLDLFFEKAPDDVRASGIFWLSKVLENVKPDEKKLLWDMLWRLWQGRIRVAQASSEPSRFSKEMSEYMRWLENSPLKSTEMFKILEFSVNWLQHGGEVVLLATYIARYAKELPLQAVLLLDAIIKRAKEPWWSPADQDEETILRAAITSGDSEAKKIAIRIINYRGDHGDFRWKDLLL